MEGESELESLGYGEFKWSPAQTQEFFLLDASMVIGERFSTGITEDLNVWV